MVLVEASLSVWGSGRVYGNVRESASGGAWLEGPKSYARDRLGCVGVLRSALSATAWFLFVGKQFSCVCNTKPE